MSKKISQLVAASDIASSDLVAVVDISDLTQSANGSTKKATISQIATAVGVQSASLPNRSIQYRNPNGGFLGHARLLVSADGEGALEQPDSDGAVATTGNVRVGVGGVDGEGWSTWARDGGDTRDYMVTGAWTDASGKDRVHLGYWGLGVEEDNLAYSPHKIQMMARETLLFAYARETPENQFAGFIFDRYEVDSGPIGGFAERRVWSLMRHTNFALWGSRSTLTDPEDALAGGEGVFYWGRAEVMPQRATPPTLGIAGGVESFDRPYAVDPSGVRFPLFDRVGVLEIDLDADPASVTLTASQSQRYLCYRATGGNDNEARVVFAAPASDAEAYEVEFENASGQLVQIASHSSTGDVVNLDPPEGEDRETVILRVETGGVYLVGTGASSSGGSGWGPWKTVSGAGPHHDLDSKVDDVDAGAVAFFTPDAVVTGIAGGYDGRRVVLWTPYGLSLVDASGDSAAGNRITFSAGFEAAGEEDGILTVPGGTFVELIWRPPSGEEVNGAWWVMDVAPSLNEGGGGLAPKIELAQGQTTSMLEDGEAEHYGTPRHYEDAVEFYDPVNGDTYGKIVRKRFSASSPRGVGTDLVAITIPLSWGDGLFCLELTGVGTYTNSDGKIHGGKHKVTWLINRKSTDWASVNDVGEPTDESHESSSFQNATVAWGWDDEEDHETLSFSVEVTDVNDGVIYWVGELKAYLLHAAPQMENDP